VTQPDAEGSKIVGFVGLGRIAEMVEAGLWIAPGFRGRGFGAEAVSALLSLASTLGLRRVVARPDMADEPSRRLLARLCFQPDGDILVRELGDLCGRAQLAA
jgi:RimJ/RimL family protein N-acetyltransferase